MIESAEVRSKQYKRHLSSFVIITSVYIAIAIAHCYINDHDNMYFQCVTCVFLIKVFIFPFYFLARRLIKSFNN